jgi:hypothetical protein
MIEDIIFVSEPTANFEASQTREKKWRHEIKMASKRRLQAKVAVNRRSAIGKPFGWPLELFMKDMTPPMRLIPEPEPAASDLRRPKAGFRSNPLVRFKDWKNAAPKKPRRPQEDTSKAMMTEATTVVGDDESCDDMVEEEIYERIDEDDLVPVSGFNIENLDLKKAEEEWELRREPARQRLPADSYIRSLIFDSHALQSEPKGSLALVFGQLFPWMLDTGLDQPAHIFWYGKEIYPQLLEHWTSDEYRAEKLFVPVDRSNATFMEVIRLLKQVDEYAALQKMACASYFCCFAIFCGKKPKQCAHIEQTCFRHDFDKRIVQKFDYDHAEDFKYDNSMNTLKKMFGYEKDGGREGSDETGAYIHAWKRLAKEGRWLFADEATGVEWIAVPWFWKHENITESTYLKHFDRCFAEEHHSIYKARPKPEFKADPEAVFEIKASVLARKSAFLHTPERSFQEVSEIIWKVQFRETPDEAKRCHDQAVRELDYLDHEPIFKSRLSHEVSAKKKELMVICRQYLERSGLVNRIATIIFKRQPRRPKPVVHELVISSKPQKTPVQLCRERMTDDQKEASKKSRRVCNLSEEQHAMIKEQKRIAEKARYDQKKLLKGKNDK